MEYAAWNVRTRLEVAVDVLNQLGGMAELELREDTYSIHGYTCPLAAAVPTCYTERGVGERALLSMSANRSFK